MLSGQLHGNMPQRDFGEISRLRIVGRKKIVMELISKGDCRARGFDRDTRGLPSTVDEQDGSFFMFMRSDRRLTGREDQEADISNKVANIGTVRERFPH